MTKNKFGLETIKVRDLKEGDWFTTLDERSGRVFWKVIKKDLTYFTLQIQDFDSQRTNIFNWPPSQDEYYNTDMDLVPEEHIKLLKLIS